MGIDFAKELNAEQLSAVTAPDGPVLVIAAAGTGKTRALTYRVAWLVAQGIDPRRILLLTFTNKAAREMLERARVLAGDAVSGLWGGTFHHMANRLLRRHPDVVGFRSDYTILDSDDARKLVGACSKDLGYASKQFPKPEVLLGLFGFASGTQKDLRDLAWKRFQHTEIPPEQILRVHARYQERKLAANAMDFDDLLFHVLLLFQRSEPIRQRYQEQFQYILVDEYQDTNQIQSAWVDLLAAQRRNLMVVGDDFQSIYSWRGADFRNIMSFPNRFAEAQVIRLEANYRSTPGILAVANQCIAGNPEQYQKTLRAVRADGRQPVLAKLRDGETQARYIVEKIAALRRKGMAPQEIAVLYRAHFHSMELQLELTRAGVPFHLTSGVRFFEQAHIKDVCTLPRLLVNPGDEMAFARLLALLPKVGEKTVARIWQKLGQRFDPNEPAAHAQLEGMLPEAARGVWNSIRPIALAYRAESLQEDAGEIIHRFTEEFYAGFAEETFENAENRLEDVAELELFTAKFDNTEHFLGEISLLTNVDAEDDHPETGKAGVRLSTIHQAKGLEWRAVFVLWLCEDMFPSSRAVEEAGDASEERRLFYVAVTRARDELCLCVPQVRRMRDGGVMFHDTSRFVRELPGLLAEDRGFF